MGVTKYGVFSIPEEIRFFSSYADVENKMNDYYRLQNKEMFVRESYDRTLRFMYLFPDGSFCVLNANGYAKETCPVWDYYKTFKDVDGYVAKYIGKYNIINSADELLKEVNPYGYAFAKNENVLSVALLFFPKLEQLKKAGYAIADTIINGFYDTFANGGNWRSKFDITDIKNISMIFHKGTSLYDILGFSRDIAKEMKDVGDINLWNSCRKLAKKGLLDVESIRFLKESDYDDKCIQKVYSIVTKGTDGKKYFTVPSLIRYLRKVDMYEAIETTEALMLIDDYIRCCHALSVKPRFDSDSLKREHDVMARNVRTKVEQEKRDKLNQKMKPACEELHKYDYKEDIFFVRAINSFDDLLDEATQQSNCVACYADSIANRLSKIFVMRETAHPEKSLITIELSPADTLRQKYMSHNRPIRNKAHSEFIDRWMKTVRAKAS